MANESYTLVAGDITKLTNAKVTMTKNGAAVVVGTKFVTGDVMKCVCAPGYRFFNMPKTNFPDVKSIYLYGNDSLAGGKTYVIFTLSESATVATWTFDYSEPYAIKTFWCETEQFVEDVKGTNNVYVVDATIMAKVNNERFLGISTGPEDSKIVDLGDYILGLIQLPFAIDPANVLNPAKIRLANRVLTTEAKEVKTDLLSLDMGSITVPKPNGSALDFLGKTVYLFLPRTSEIELQLNDVIGQTIKIEYLIDLYSGDATVNVRSSSVGDKLVHTSKVSLGIQIPYGIVGWNSAVDNKNIKLGVDNGIKIPYIELTSKTPVLKDGFFSASTYDDSKMGSYTGYMKVDEISLESLATTQEKDEILNILKNGVYVK